jgi:hypothetical protein
MEKRVVKISAIAMLAMLGSKVWSLEIETGTSLTQPTIESVVANLQQVGSKIAEQAPILTENIGTLKTILDERDTKHSGEMESLKTAHAELKTKHEAEKQQIQEEINEHLNSYKNQLIREVKVARTNQATRVQSLVENLNEVISKLGGDDPKASVRISAQLISGIKALLQGCRNSLNGINGDLDNLISHEATIFSSNPLSFEEDPPEDTPSDPSKSTPSDSSESTTSDPSKSTSSDSSESTPSDLSGSTTSDPNKSTTSDLSKSTTTSENNPSPIPQERSLSGKKPTPLVKVNPTAQKRPGTNSRGKKTRGQKNQTQGSTTSQKKQPVR